MNTRNIIYCRNCNEIGVSAYTLDGWRTCYCAQCRSKASTLGNGIHIGSKRLYAIGDLHGVLVIPEGVTEIFPDSLNNTSIRSIQFPRSLQKIPFECFKYCRNLEEIVIPQTVTEIGGGAFEGCSALKKVTINGHTIIYSSAFNGCNSLKELVINGSVHGSFPLSYPLEECKYLERITVNRSGNVGTLRFSAIPNLKKVSLLCAIKETNGGALSKLPNFSGCKKLEEAILENVETVGFHTFSHCSQLKNVTIGKTVKRIDSYAFYDCISLESITIPEGCIEVSGFNNCTNLKNINIPQSVKKLGDYAFQNCKRFETFAIPEGVEELGCSAFEGCSNLKAISLPSTLRRIGNQAFKGCTSLEKIVLPDGLQEIGDRAFEQCSRIRALNLPASLKKIGSEAFKSLPVHLAIIPGGITELGESAFEEYRSWYSEQKHRYVVSPNTYAEAYFKKAGLKYEVAVRKDGALLEAPITDGVLYYLKPTKGKVEIPLGVESIEANAVLDQETINEIILSDSVKEIRPFAFANSTKLASVTFGRNIERIGAKAFFGLTNTLIDLPKSIKEIAPDAFGEGCIISVGEKMPFYSAKQAEIETAQKQLQAKDDLIAALQRRLETLEEELTSYINSKSAEFLSIPQYQARVFDIESKIAEHKRICLKKQTELNAQHKQLEATIGELVAQRDKCFFLAISKKKELDANIQSKQQKLQAIQCEQTLFAEESTATNNLLLAELSPVKNKLEELSSAQRRWASGKENRQNNIQNVKSDLQRHREEHRKLEVSLSERTIALERDYKQWQEARDTLALRQKTSSLLTEKSAILSALKLPTHNDIPLYTYQHKKSIIEDSQLNNAFLEMIAAWNYEDKATRHNRYIGKHQNKICRIQEINTLLGFAEDDGISEYCLMEESPVKAVFLPKRFTSLNTWFAQTSHWVALKFATKEFTCLKSPKKNLYDKFFAGCDYFAIADDGKFLLVFPYCMVKYEANKPLSVLTYDKTKLTVTYTDRTDSGYSTLQGGELVNMEFMYLNKDGSPSKRYKDNPIIRTYRFTKVTITDGADSFSFPFDTYNAAEQFVIAFNNYFKVIVDGEYRDIYKVVLNSADIESVETAIQKHTEAEKQREEEKKKRAEAKRIAAQVAEEAAKKRKEEERLAAIAAAEEEKKRIEAERLAVQAAAEEKRKAIIQRQKELNEERKRQASEKKKIFGMFEDDPTEENREQEVKPVAEAAPLEIIGKRLISNNVFKVQMKQVATISATDAICYFTTEDGTTISNKKKLPSGDIGSELTIGFILLSGIDYTQVSSCLMRIESQGAVLGEIDFKMNISFYSDF